MVDKISFEEAKKEFQELRYAYLEIDGKLKTKLATDPLGLIGIPGQIILLGNREQKVIERIKISFTEHNPQRNKLRKEYEKLDKLVTRVQNDLKWTQTAIQDSTMNPKGEPDATRQTPEA